MLTDRDGLQLLTAASPVSQSDDVAALLQTYGDWQQKAVIAEGLKRELAKAADYCAAVFRSNTVRP